MRRRLLRAFEQAERSSDPEERRRLLTIAVVGAGPTGVELAGAVAELARHTLVSDYREIHPEDARVLLIEAKPRVLPGFPEPLAAYATRALEDLNVEVRCEAMVEDLDEDGVTVAGERVPAATVLWSAGIAASPAGRWLDVETDRGGRVPVDATLAVPDRDGVFVLGDTARVDGPDGQPLPGLAQVAKQEGQHLGRQLRRNLVDGRPIEPFRYRDRGQLATIGRNRALADLRRLRLTGTKAWWLWGLVHLGLLAGGQNRAAVAVRWLYHYLTYDRGARLITDEPGMPRDARWAQSGSQRSSETDAAE
jgi:NADH dehydrogenase